MTYKITATAPTVYQLNSLRAFNLNQKANGNGSYTGEAHFETEEEAKTYLRARAEKYNSEDPCGTDDRLTDMYRDIESGVLRLDAVTAYVKEIEESEEDSE
jgi:hypothetical protein